MTPRDSHFKFLSCFIQKAPSCCGPFNLAGTARSLPRFPDMRIREENCNMVLLAAVIVFSAAIAGGATLIGTTDNKPLRLAADRMTGRVEQSPPPDRRIIRASDQPPVRVIGAPFIPNTNPRQR